MLYPYEKRSPTKASNILGTIQYSEKHVQKTHTCTETVKYVHKLYTKLLNKINAVLAIF